MTDYSDAIDQVLGKVETEVPTITPETLPKVTQETDNPYEGVVADYIQSQDSNEKIANNQNSYLASQEDRQKALSINKLARDFGVNYEAAKISENELSQQKKNKDYSNTLEKVKTDSPKLYEKLNTPEKLAIAHDDIDNLSLFDRVTKSFEQSTQTGQDNLRLARIAEKQFLGQELTAIEINDLRNIESRQSKTKDYDINWFLGIPEAVSENIPLMADPFLSKEAFTGAGIGAGIGGATGSAAAGVGAIPGAIGGAATGFFWGRNARIARNETALAFSEFSKFTDDDGVVIEPNTARAGAIVSGLISTGLESIGLKSIAKTVPQADEFLQKFTKVGVKKAFKNKVVRGYMKRFGDVVQASATEGGTEFLQEFSQSIIGEISKAISSGNFDAFTSQNNPEAGFWGWLADTSEKSIKAGLRGSQGGAGFASVGTAISVGIEKSQKKIQAKQEQSLLQKAVEKAENSTVAKDDPDLFLELTDDPDSNAYMSPQEVKEFFQDKPEQYALFQEKIPELKDQIDEAIETGGDLVLPANKVSLALADMGIKDMVKIMRLTPEAISDTDAIAQINELDTIDIYDDETNKSFEYRDTIKDQLMNSGFVPETAKSYTDALMSFYDTQYIRTAKSPEARQKLNEYYENLVIRNVTDAEQTKNLDELDLLVERAKLYRGRQGKFKQRPLQSFFKQQGGIKSDTSFAGDLRSLGISNKGGVFKAKSDFRYDAIPVSEFEDHFQVKNVPDDGQGYVPTDFLSDIADQELQGVDWRDDYSANNQPIKEAKNILNLLDKANIDIATANPEQIRQVLTGAQSELFQETKFNQGTFDPQDPRILYQDKESIKRGSFIKTPRGNVSIINVFKDHDLSTILHETGHFYLEVMRDLATAPDAPAEIKADWQELKNWLELDGNKINTEAHENFARGFEAYLMEGNAPSQLLLDVFRKFKSWLTNIYKTIASLDVTLNDDVRAIFDRMLATEFETENLKNKNLFRPDPEILKMLTKAEQDAYIARNEKAIAETQEKALSKGIKERRKQQKDVIDKERAGIEKDARERIYNEPIHKLRYFLDKGKMPLEEQESLIEDARLNRDLLAQEYGEEYVKLIPSKYLSKDGEAPSMVADLFGFADDGQMLNALINAPKAEQEIKRSVNEDIKNRYGDPLNDGTIERDALDAAYEDAREDNINYEYQVIKRKTDTITAGKKQLESRAKEIVSETKVGDIIAPHKYYRAEVRAAAEAQKHLAKKNYEQAAKAKQRQLLNYYLYRESRNARQFTEKTLKRFKKYQKRPAAGKVKIDEDYRQKAVQLINAFDFASRSNKKDAIKTLNEWQEQKEQDDGVTFLEVEPQILEYNDKQHFRDMSYQDFYSLAENIENIIAQGRLNRSIEIDGKRQEIADIAQELTTQVQENFKGVNIPFEPRTRGEQLKRTFKEFFYSTIKARTFFRELDGFKEFGNFYKYILNPINQASNKMLARQQDVAKQLNDIFDTHYEGRLAGDLNKKTYITSLGQSVSKQAMLSYALNYGAVENRDRLITDNNLTEAQLNEILSQLTKKDFTFVQDVWNFLEAFKADIWALEKRRNGIEPQEVQKVGFQVTTKDGSTMQLDGGYYPIKYEQEKSVQVTQETLEDLKNVTSKSAQTKRGHTKARAKNVNKPLRNDLGVLFSHVSQVVHDLEMGETLQNSYKILKKNDLSNSIVRAKGRAFYDQLEMWIQDQAIGGSLGAQGMESLLDGLRSGVSISTMGFKASTVLVQLTGVTQTMATIGSKYGLKGLVKTFGNGNPAFIKDAFQVAYEKSAILSERSETFNRDVNDAMRQMQAGGKFKQKLTQLAFYPMIKTQAIVDVMAWHGAYQKGLDTLDGNEAKAIEYADDIIVRSQGSGSLKDLSALERGTISANNRFNKFAKLFTVYYSYFNTKLNIAYEKTKNTDFKNPESVLNLATDYFLLYMLEYALGAIILGQLPSDEKDDDYATWLLKGTMGNIAGQVPILREMYSVSQGFDASPAGLRGLGEIPKAGMSLLKAGSAAFDDNEDINLFKLLRDVNMAGGIVFKYPASQVNQALRAMEKSSKGEDVAPSEYLLYKK